MCARARVRRTGCASLPLAGRRGCGRGSRARPESGPAFPFASTGSSGSNVIAASADRIVVSSTSTEPTGAADCRRAAVFTTSPVTMPSPRSGRAPSATTASPVVTAARTASSRPSSRNSSMVSRIRRPERTARSASSSCATGAPKTAMTASPMNFSTVPPNRSMSALTRSWYGRSVARTSSGSARSDRFVKPTRSTKRTETTFRSSPAGASLASDCPQARQKRARSGFSSPQCGQVSMCGSSQCPPAASMRPEGAARPRPRRGDAAARCARERR